MANPLELMPRSFLAFFAAGFWDAYRTVYPMLSLFYPDTMGQIIQGWVNAYSEGGWLPKVGFRRSSANSFCARKGPVTISLFYGCTDIFQGLLNPLSL